jgi:hypothetical protein
MVGAALLLSLVGCGGSGSTSRSASTSTTAAPSALAAWATQTQQLCIQKREAIARLGYVNITYAGIARVGLAAVKRLLDRYLGRLLAVLRDFHQRQRQVPTPASVAPAMRLATALDGESRAATSQLQAAVAKVQTAGQLSSAFSAWTARLQRLSARGDALTRQLNLAACRSAA